MNNAEKVVELNKLIENSGLKKSFIAQKLGISRQSLSNKLRGERDFKLAEITSLCLLLGLEKKQKEFIFF